MKTTFATTQKTNGNILKPYEKPNEKTGKKGLIFKSLLAASLVLLPACAAGPESNTTPAESNNVTTEKLTDEPNSYVGQEVTVRANVEEKVDETAFVMESDGFLNNEKVLVINASSEPFLIPDVGDSQVQVTGKVETFSMATAAKDYNLTLDADRYGEYENKPVIIANSLALAPDPGDITANPEKYYNQRIAVQGEVEDILEAGLFTIDEEKLFSGEDLLVIPNQGAKTVQDGEDVVVTGVLRPYVKADFDRDYNLQWDLSVTKSIEAEYTQKPVFVADSVYPSAID